MTQTLITYHPVADFEKTSTSFIKPAIHSNSEKIPKKLRKAIATLERLDIGWLDILTAMVNIAEQWGDEQVAEVLEATALSLKQNRTITRDL